MSYRDTIYVVGAGFSAGLGFPLTGDLLVRLWDEIDLDLRQSLESVIRFHHPNFNPKHFSSFPNVRTVVN